MKDCKTVMDSYMNLDKGERVPFWITSHLLTCKNCRKRIELMRMAEESFASDGEKQSAFNNATILAVMNKISGEKKSDSRKKNPISFAVWIIFGVLMIAGIAGAALSIRADSNKKLTVYNFVQFSVLIISYCALFVKSNYDFFVKKIGKKDHAGQNPAQSL